MELIVTWIITIIASVVLDTANSLRVFKDAADEGYKIDVSKINGLSDESNSANRNIEHLSLLIPFLNIFLVTLKAINYNENRYSILEQLNCTNALEEMSKFEKEEYIKKPTILNAVLVPIKFEIDLKKSMSIKIKSKDGESQIFFKEDSNDIKILKATGPASNLTEEELKNEVNKTIEVTAQALVDKLKASGVDEFVEELKNLKEIQIIQDKKTENKEELHVNNNTPTSENYNINNNKEELEGPKLIKKLK